MNGLYLASSDICKCPMCIELILINGNGNIKEYLYGELEYDGEYLNGERNGKGKEYYSNGKLKFEGEYINGKKMEKEKNIIKMEN